MVSEIVMVVVMVIVVVAEEKRRMVARSRAKDHVSRRAQYCLGCNPTPTHSSRVSQASIGIPSNLVSDGFDGFHSVPCGGDDGGCGSGGGSNGIRTER